MSKSPASRKWQVKPPTPEAAGELSRALGLPRLVAQLLCHRGYGDPDRAAEFLSPRLDSLPLPEGFLNLDKAVGILVPAVRQGLCIGVAGDYDADGVTATAVLVDFFRQLGAEVVWDLPHRLNDGYGLSPGRSQRLAQAGAKVLVTVDCGISDHEGVRAAQELGMQVVVTDHHQVPPGEPVPAQAVVNPQQEACGFAPELAGVGVAFYLAAALRAALRSDGYFSDRPMPNLRDSLDLVAVGTCADVVPLTGCNRIMVREGVRLLGLGGRPGLAALAQVAGIKGELDSRDVGFGLAPRINAAGRMEHPGQALDLLLSADPVQALALAQGLDRLNRRRRQTEEGILRQVEQAMASDPKMADSRFLVLGDSGWHRGVLGIVASRLVERTGRPTLMFSLDNGKAVGSGRSVPGFHLQQALCQVEDLLVRFGGHAMAAGVTVETPRLNQLAARLDELARSLAPAPEEAGALELEDEVGLGELGPELMEAMEALAPFGAGNPEPLVALRDVTVNRSFVVGKRHLKLELWGDGRRVPAIGFNLGADSALPSGSRVDLAATPRISGYGGRHLELVVKDIRPATGA